MSCDTPVIGPSDFPDPSIKSLLLGSAKRISISVYQPKSDSALEDCGGCLDRTQLQIPPTVTITSATIAIYNRDNLTTPILTDNPSITDILDDTLTLIGFKISYLINTNVVPMNAVGFYLVLFRYTLDNGEISQVPIMIELVAPGWLSTC